MQFDEARFNELKTRESALVSQLRVRFPRFFSGICSSIRSSQLSRHLQAIGYEVPANPVPAIECPPVASGSTTPGTEAMAKPQLA